MVMAHIATLVGIDALLLAYLGGIGLIVHYWRQRS